MAYDTESRPSIFELGKNCASVANADHVSVIIDGEQYFADLQIALKAAEKQIVFVGWDFDTRVHLDGGTDTQSLRSLIESLLRKNKSLRIYILKWNVGALKVLLRGRMILTIARWMVSKRFKIKFDGKHPVGASHHQKLVVIDGALAFCGGIDATSGRWDTREHSDNDTRRVTPDGEPADPWHDLSMVLDGDAAQKLHELASDRWQRATGKRLPVIKAAALWPFTREATFEAVQVAIARTRGEYREEQAIRENEALFVDMIKNAKRFVYAENQYFASRTIAAAIARRLQEADPPEFVIVMPEKADGWLEQVAMDTARSQLVAMVKQNDVNNRFRIYHPFTKGGTAIYVHAKLTIVDDRVIRIGSSNMNNRSLGFDSECDVAIAALDSGGKDVQEKILSVRASLIAEHLDRNVEEVRDALGQISMIGMIEAMRGEDRTLRPYEQEDSPELAEFVASQNLLDPIGEDQMQSEKIGARPRLYERFKSMRGKRK